MNKKDFTQIPNFLIRDKNITDAVFRTYVVLKSFKYGKGKVFPSQKTLAEIQGKSKKSIIDHLKILKEKEIIGYKRRGYSQSNLYTFISEEIFTTIVNKTSPDKLHKLQPNNTEFKKTETNNLRGDNKNSYKRRELTSEEEDLIERIVEWNIRPVFNTVLPEKRVRMMVTNTVKKYGFEDVWEIYNEVANKSYAPHPMDFWNEIKALKEDSQ